MSQWIMISYAILLLINAVMFVLLVIHMIKFHRFHRNFLAIVQNVQSYLNCVMHEEENANKNLSDEVYQMDDTEKERILGSVLGEIFS